MELELNSFIEKNSEFNKTREPYKSSKWSSSSTIFGKNSKLNKAGKPYESNNMELELSSVLEKNSSLMNIKSISNISRANLSRVDLE